MRFFGVTIALCVGLIMAGGVVLTYKHRKAEMGGDIAIVSPGQFVKNVASLHSSLPKWDDKNYKGLTYHEPGYYKKKAEADKKAASKQSAAR